MTKKMQSCALRMAFEVLAFVLLGCASADSCVSEIEGSKSTLLLQVAGQKDKAPPSMGRYAWVHVPKAGSTFGLSLLTLPGACLPGVADEIFSEVRATYATEQPHAVDIILDNMVNTSSCPGLLISEQPKVVDKSFSSTCIGMASHMLKLTMDSMPGAEDSGFISSINAPMLAETSLRMSASGFQFASDHSGIGGFHGRVAGNMLGMFRSPESRITSAFNDMFHSWPVCALPYDTPPTLLEFAKVTAGCAVKMLTRGGKSFMTGWANTVCGDPWPPSTDEVALAVRRLHEGFTFVGLQEKWELSMCLLHKKFGGVCSSPEFVNWSSNDTMPSWKLERHSSDLGDFKDVFDGVLYMEAERVFNESLLAYDVSYSSCQPCFDAAGVTISPDQ